ncbi:MAG: hypothetical protein JKY65_18910 [Planctomycetes bacterium]|nr:hypothetical protein [Planctomycetota bacterium]
MTNPAEYEFTEPQNEIFKGLVRNMKRSGAVVGITGMILLAYQIVDHLELSLSEVRPMAIGYLDLTVWCLLAVVGVIVGGLLIKATRAFTAVIETEGNDIKHLMEGLTSLRGVFKLIFVTASAGSALLTLSFVLLVVY